MGNILTYLKWRGDLTFAERSFNEVDNLVLAELSYLRLEGIVPGIKANTSITVEETFQAARRRKSACLQNKLLENMANSTRFKNARLRNYLEILETEGEGIQFGAMEILLEDGSSYIAFRGTDSSIIGWKEDFALGYKVVPAQKKAVEYLNTVMCKDGKYRVGGHSKGGNLAVYSAMMCEAVLQEKILEIYNNDGPELCSELINPMKYEVVKSRIIKIVPEFSVIGQLFAEGRQSKIVKSKGNGIFQHGAMNWQVEGCCFEKVPQLDKECVFYNNLFNEWIGNASMEERESFVNNFFDALESSEASSMGELAKGGPQTWEKVLTSMKNTDRTAKKTFLQFLKLAWKNIKSVSLTEVFHEKKMVLWLAVLALGIFFLSFPYYSAQILGTMAFLCLFLYALYKTICYEKNRQKDCALSKKELLWGTLALFLFLCMLNGTIAKVQTSIVLGIFFGFRAYKQGKYAVQKAITGNNRKRIMYAIDAVAASGFCVLSFVFSKSVQGDIMLAAGSYLIIVSAVELGLHIWKKAEKQDAAD